MKVLSKFYFLMEPLMEIQLINKEMVMENSHLLMEIAMKEIGKMIKLMDLECFCF